jgi:DNA-binding response OmpR family regulator
MRSSQTVNTHDHKKTILLISKDDDLRFLLRQYLASQGYRLIFALDEEDALTLSKELKAPVDLILIDQLDMSMNDALNMGNELRLYAGMESTTPLIVLAQKYSEELEGQDVAVGECEYITYCSGLEQLYALLAGLLPIHHSYALL